MLNAALGDNICPFSRDQLGEPRWGPIGKDVYERTYSRKKANGENEDWFETIWRVVVGNTALVPERFIEAGERANLFTMFYYMNSLPAGRHLWVSGVPGRAFIANCWGAFWDSNFSRHFTFTFMRLMEGGGVGANYSNKYIKQYKPFKREVNVHFVSNKDHKDYEEFKHLLSSEFSPDWTGSVVIPDDREGWADSLQTLLDAYYDEGDDEPLTIVYDISNIRPRGSRIRGFGGSASGPFALMLMLKNISNLVNSRKGTKPDSLLLMQIDHQIGCCVIAGNVRRSARMSMKHWLDSDILDFIFCKADGTSHWSSNISVVIDNNFFRSLKRKDSKHHILAKAVLQAIAEGMLCNGEPGIYNIDKASEGEPNEAVTTNPCGEIAFSSPAENCTLGHVNMASFVRVEKGKSIVDEAGLYSAMRLMARFLIRATYSDFPDEEARKIADINRRIGVGFFGFHEFVVMMGKKFSECYTDKEIRHILKKCYQVVRKEVRDYAFELRIPEPIKCTTVAPTGTIAKLTGTSEGMHPIFSPFFKRRVRYSTTDPDQLNRLQELKAEGYPVEPDQRTPNTDVVTFFVKDTMAVKVEENGLSTDLIEAAAEIHLEDSLAVQAMVQECYADNAISFTANVIQDQYDVHDIMKALEIYGPRIKGCTVMPDFSNIPQLPMERIDQEEWAKFHGEIGSGIQECNSGCPIK